MAAAARFLAFFALTACGGDGDPPVGGSSGAATGQPDDDGSSTAAPDTTGTTTPTTSLPTAGSSGGASESGTGTGCSTATDCADGEFCDFPDDSCGISGVAGTCAPVIEGCGADSRPVCACGDVLYDNACAASAAGVDVSFVGACPLADPLAFRCGFSFCISGEEYCLAQAGAMPSAECIPLPPVCIPADCSCITTCCGCNNASCCSEYCINDDGDLTFTCP